jgi:serralysin
MLMPISRSRYASFSGSPLFASQGDLLTAQAAFSLAPADSFFKLTTAKATTALLQDGVGDIHPPLPTTLLVVTPDEAGDGKGVAPGNPVLTVDAAHTIGTINTIGDQDFYQVTLEAGKTYQIGMYGYTGGPGGEPNADSYVEVYAADGTTLIVSGDGGADTPANQVNSGFDVLLTYTPDTTGTYYINARAFDQDPTNGTTGDGVGDYELFVHDATNDPNIYHPYYTPDSPLYAIDWGTRVNRVNQSAANPDGNEGPRPTGNAQGTPTYGSALDMNAILVANGKTAADIVGKNVITIYFAKAGEVVTALEDPSNPGLPPAAVETSSVSDFEHNAVMTALHEFEKVADVVYLEVQDKDQADFEYASYKGTPGPGVSLLGSMEPPDEPNEGLALFNSGDARWNATDLQQGGFSFVTLIHEIGHGHGLAHPHDNGGHSGIMHGVQPDGPVASYTLGDYDLNQGVYTMMSYEDGWQTSPYGNAPTTGGYGYLGSLMAFDIAAIQDKYGVNEDWATGDDVYTIKDVNAPGTYYSSIWDAGGTDEIRYVGTRDANIDLRPATLQYEYGGGGWVSYAYGIFGGYTIANGVTIENATSGDGNDKLFGNAADNVMDSGGGNDLIVLDAGGNDTARGGAGNDFIYFGNAMTADDKVDGGSGTDTLGLIGTYASLTFGADSLVGIERIAVYTSSYISGAAPASYNLTTIDANVGPGGLFVTAASLQSNETLTFNGTAETDGAFTIIGGAGADRIAGGAGNDYIDGHAGDDQLFCLGGNDYLVGGAGADQLRGGAGADTFRYLSISDSTAASADHIVDFGSNDRIELTAIDADTTQAGDQAFTFIGDAAFTAAGQLRTHFDAGTGLWSIEGDVNGDGNPDLVILVHAVTADPLVASEFLL